MKRLHRSTEDRKIAGVCAGLGEYFELDPVFFRLFFLFSILFGGLGAIAYLMLWILVPLREGVPVARSAAPLRLSASERMIAGVCGGLGEFFQLDPVLFRAAFLVLAVIGGLGILLYLVLWLLIPGPAPAAGEPPSP
ncbi:MAG: PspC domain-containing protein [Betaproteobacteria bacterium]|nr:PspC domain-containing protein [Betaproteobacteria bacterium]